MEVEQEEEGKKAEEDEIWQKRLNNYNNNSWIKIMDKIMVIAIMKMKEKKIKKKTHNKISMAKKVIICKLLRMIF